MSPIDHGGATLRDGSTAGRDADSLCWSSPPARAALSEREVHVWKAALDLSPARLRGLAEFLADNERQRASRFVFERDRRRFIVARAFLRAILGRYLGDDPRSVEFRYSRHGKPEVAARAGTDRVRFNVSHTDETAIYGVTLGRDIGVDIERVRDDFATDEIAERFFSRREVAAFLSLSAADRPPAFFRCWTRKEAYVKARGEGLSLSLSEFDVSLLPGEPAALVSTRNDPLEASRWSLRELPVGPGYVGAVAAQGHGWRLRCWEFQ